MLRIDLRAKRYSKYRPHLIAQEEGSGGVGEGISVESTGVDVGG